MVLITVILFSITYTLNKYVYKFKNILSCGLLGYSGKDFPNQAIIKLFFIDNESRGTHSAGIGSVLEKNGRESPYYFKTKGKASDMISEDVILELLKSKQIIGHTRYATMGSLSDENAHPYDFPGVLGTHNGWLLDSDKARIDDKEYSFLNTINKFNYSKEELSVDSMLIYKHISSKNNIKAVEDIEGAMALAFLKNNYLYLYRRDSKPLYYCKYNDGIYYSSRKESFELSFGKSFSEKEVFLLPSNIMFKIKEGDIVDKIKIKEPKIKIKLDEPPTSFYSRTNPAPSYYKNNYKIKNYVNEEKSTVNSLGHGINNDHNLAGLGYEPCFIDLLTNVETRKIDKGSLVIFKLNSSDNFKGKFYFNKTKDLSNIRIISDHMPNTVYLTDKDGTCRMYIPEGYFKGGDKIDINISIHPPFDFRVSNKKDFFYPLFYYKVKNISISKNVISESSFLCGFYPSTSYLKSSISKKTQPFFKKIEYNYSILNNNNKDEKNVKAGESYFTDLYIKEDNKFKYNVNEIILEDEIHDDDIENISYSTYKDLSSLGLSLSHNYHELDSLMNSMSVNEGDTAQLKHISSEIIDNISGISSSLSNYKKNRTVCCICNLLFKLIDDFHKKIISNYTNEDYFLHIIKKESSSVKDEVSFVIDVINDTVLEYDKKTYVV